MSHKLIVSFVLVTFILVLSGCVTTNVTGVDRAKGAKIVEGAPLNGVKIYLSSVVPSKDNKATSEQAYALIRQYGATIANSKNDAKLIISFDNMFDLDPYRFTWAPFLMPLHMFSLGIIPINKYFEHRVEISVKLNNSYSQKLLLKQSKYVESRHWVASHRLVCGGDYPEYCEYEKPQALAALISTMNEIVEMRRNGDF